MQDIRKQFPIFAKHPHTIFFDNASTTQKPQSVIDKITDFYSNNCSNASRASYRMATQATEAIKHTRNQVANFINARPQEIVFTSGATESLNLVALAWGMHNLHDGDEVMVCLQDHQSAVLPWLNLQNKLKSFGINISIVPFEYLESGGYNEKSIGATLSKRTKLIAISHIHHLYGIETNTSIIREIVGKDILISLDASQSIGHTPIDIKSLAVDFLSFSGHKMFAGNGTGILWINPKLHNQFSPAKLGGRSSVAIKNEQLVDTAESLGDLLESGTQNIPGILSLNPAISFIKSCGWANIQEHLNKLTFYLWENLRQLPFIQFAPGIASSACLSGFGIIAFHFENIPSVDIAFALDSENVFVRTGSHCVAKLNEEEDYIRVSMQAYNTKEEIDRFIHILKSILNVGH